MGSIEPKPLSEAERTAIHDLSTQAAALRPIFYERAVMALLAAEAFWRQAVKNAEFLRYDEDGSECWFCGEAQPLGVYSHTSTCPWLLAQD